MANNFFYLIVVVEGYTSKEDNIQKSDKYNFFSVGINFQLKLGTRNSVGCGVLFIWILHEISFFTFYRKYNNKK